MNVEQVFPQVKTIIADVLMMDADQITLSSRLIDDLGAESIDFLDLIFQLEKNFHIKIPRGQIEKNARGQLSESEFEQGGELTEKGLKALKTYLSEIPPDAFKPRLKVSEIPLLFTVETFCKLVVSSLETQQVTEPIT